MDPTLIFSTRKHGFSLKSLIEKCEDTSAVPCVLLVKDRSKGIFGAFASKVCGLLSSFLHNPS